MASTIESLPCNVCGSADNIKVFLNQSGIQTSKCMTPDCLYNHTKEIDTKYLVGTVKEQPIRGLSLETCRRLNYQIGRDKGGELVKILNWYDDDNKLIGQKIKQSPDPETGKKRMYFLNHNKKVGLYGKWLWSPNPNLFITVTEGEEDMMTVMQVQGYQFPVVSLPKGAEDAKGAIERDLKYLLRFKYVILAFDNDEAGRRATEQCIEILEPGKVRVAIWPLKDANEMLLARRENEFREILFGAKEVIPDKSVTVSDILDRILAEPTKGLSLPWKSMTEITGGLKPGEIIGISAAPAVGKTEIVVHILNHLINTTGIKAGIFGLEQNTEDTMKRMAGYNLGLQLHIDGITVSQDILKDEVMRFEKKVYLYNDVGEIEEKDIFSYMRFWNKANGVTVFILDNLQAVDISDDLPKLKRFTNKLKRLMKELQSTAIIVSHVNVDGIKQSTHVGFSSKVKDPHGELSEERIRDTMNKFKLDWENGRIPQSKNIEGGKYLIARADYIFVFARDRNSSNEKTQRTIIGKCIKARRDSRQDGREFMLYYNNLGRLEEIEQISTEDLI